MDSFGGKTLNQPKSSLTSPHSKDGGNKSIDKKAAVDEERKRMNQLPANSAYATHRLKVLNKVLQLLSIQRTTSQEDELELLFASLSI